MSQFDELQRFSDFLALRSSECFCLQSCILQLDNDCKLDGFSSFLSEKIYSILV